MSQIHGARPPMHHHNHQTHPPPALPQILARCPPAHPSHRYCPPALRQGQKDPGIDEIPLFQTLQQLLLASPLLQCPLGALAQQPWSACLCPAWAILGHSICWALATAAVAAVAAAAEPLTAPQQQRGSVGSAASAGSGGSQRFVNGGEHQRVGRRSGLGSWLPLSLLSAAAPRRCVQRWCGRCDLRWHAHSWSWPARSKAPLHYCAC
mmetsp:Transcript_3276/g.8774  ORF Transcript_3276/g.8774 Transcript_3276/m.8774 type:complete len:208 (-) Transcript_3276:1414-2037(-)